MSYQFGSERPKLDARLQGAGSFTAAANSTTSHYFTLGFDCLFNGLQIYSADSTLGDTVSLEVQYLYGETWKRYKRFGKDWLLFPGNPLELILFPAWPKNGMRLAFEYTNTHATNSAHFFVNLFTFADQETVDPTQGQEGTDW